MKSLNLFADDDLLSGGLNFSIDHGTKQIIKIVGVGGAGSSILNYIYNQDLKGADMVVCNTDLKDLNKSPIKHSLQLGTLQTKGLGAGMKPDIGEQAALESMEQIRQLFPEKNEMVFITAGMGGGTGTGAAPIIAKVAKEMGKLVVAVVTTPYNSEGPLRTENARRGLAKLKKNVDAMLVIHNDKLVKHFPDLGFTQSWGKVNDILYQAVKNLVDMIREPADIVVDMADTRTALTNSGTLFLATGIAEGENRAQKLCENTFDDPIISDINLSGAKHVIIIIRYYKKELTNSEYEYVLGVIRNATGEQVNISISPAYDSSLENEELKMTIIASGFDSNFSFELPKEKPEVVSQIRADENYLKTEDSINFADSVRHKNLDGVFGINKQVEMRNNDLGVSREHTVYSLDSDEFFDGKDRFVTRSAGSGKLSQAIEALQNEQKQKEPQLDFSKIAYNEPFVSLDSQSLDPFNCTAEEARELLAKKRDSLSSKGSVKPANNDSIPAFMRRGLELEIKSVRQDKKEDE